MSGMSDFTNFIGVHKLATKPAGVFICSKWQRNMSIVLLHHSVNEVIQFSINSGTRRG
jgi:hypothetical protein